MKKTENKQKEAQDGQFFLKKIRNTKLRKMRKQVCRSKAPTYSPHKHRKRRQLQCDQIWRYFATLEKLYKSLAVLSGFILYWAKF